jgi:DNA-binding beta-propeller fold protein YncE
MRKYGSLSLSLLVLALVAACGGSSTPASTPTPPPTYTAYFLNAGDGTLVGMPLATGVVGTPIKVASGPNQAFGLAITKDGKTAYISGGGNIVIVNLVTGTVGTPIVVAAGISGPIALAVTPDGKMAYAVNYNAGTVIPVNLTTGEVMTPIVVATGDNHPLHIAITADGKTAYVTTLHVTDKTTAAEITAELVPIDLKSGTVGTSLHFSHQLGSFAITPDGKMAYAFYLNLDASGNLALTVTPVSLPSGKLGVSIPVSVFVNALAISPDGKSLYLVNSFGVKGGAAPQGGVLVMDLATGTLGAPTITGAQPNSVVIVQDPR